MAAEASSSRDVDAAHPTVLAQDSLSDVVSGVGATTCIHSVQSSGGHTANNDPRNASAGLDAHGPQDCAAKSKSVGGLRAEYRVDMRCDFRHLMNSNFFNGWRLKTSVRLGFPGNSGHLSTIDMFAAFCGISSTHTQSWRVFS